MPKCRRLRGRGTVQETSERERVTDSDQSHLDSLRRPPRISHPDFHIPFHGTSVRRGRDVPRIHEGETGL